MSVIAGRGRGHRALSDRRARRRSRAAEGVRLRHVKAHGALYNMADQGSRRSRTAIARAVRPSTPRLVLFGLPGTELLRAGRGGRPARRCRRLCRPQLRGGRLADAAQPARGGDRRRRGGRGARRAHGSRGRRSVSRTARWCRCGSPPSASTATRPGRTRWPGGFATGSSARGSRFARPAASRWRIRYPEASSGGGVRRRCRAKRALLAAGLGWMLDSFDVMLYALVLAVADGGPRHRQADGGLLGSVTLIAAAAGGAAVRGHRRSLRADQGADGRASSSTRSSRPRAAWRRASAQLAVFRVLLGIGMGGEWASGASLVSESWPREHRGKALGLMQSAWAVGYGAAAIVDLAGAAALRLAGGVLRRRRAGAADDVDPARVEEPAIWQARAAEPRARRSRGCSRPARDR